MYLVAVCDDEQAHAQAIAQTIRHEFASRGYPVSTDVYANSTALMKRLEQGTCYDVLFLDIDMPMLNGIELCRRIREIKGNTLVVFISNCEEMVFQVFEVAPFRFIRKRRFSTEIGNVIRDLVVELDRRSSHFLRLQDERDDSLYSVNVRDLMYVEAQRKKSSLHSIGQTVDITIQFGTIAHLLQPFSFFQIHRSYIVNPNYIYRINNDTVMLDNREELPLSRAKKAQIQKAFFTWSRGIT